MKQYTGTKTVKAEPMTKGEAYEKNLLKKGVELEGYEKDMAGYCVEYSGGYRSWCPAPIFEAAYKPSESFLDRLRIERDELKERLDKLDKFFEPGIQEISEKIGCAQASMLIYQRVSMNNYLETLESRIDNIENNSK